MRMDDADGLDGRSSRADEEVLVCDVGDESSDAVIKLNTTRIERGSPVQIGSFTIAMP